MRVSLATLIKARGPDSAGSKGAGSLPQVGESVSVLLGGTNSECGVGVALVTEGDGAKELPANAISVI